MPDTDKKSRDIKDLKARLGRGSAPGHNVGQPGAFPPGTASSPAWTGPGSRPPAAGGAIPGSSPAIPGAAPAAGRGIVAPPFAQRPGKAAPLPTPGGIVAPPFAQQQQQQAAAAPAKKSDPFGGAAAAPAVEEKKVTLVVDDSAVQESEIGTVSRSRNLFIIAAGLVAGIAVGYMVGNTTGDRRLWSRVIQDAKDLYKTVDEVSRVVDQAKKHVQAITDASRGGPGTKATVNYTAIAELAKIPKPLSASAFHQKRYKAFAAGTVDDLFDYYGNINVLWDKFAALNEKTKGEEKRKALKRSAEIADFLINNQYGMVPRQSGDKLVGDLVYVSIPAPQYDEQGQPIPSAALNVSSQADSEFVEKQRFMGQSEFTKKPDDYVILINKSLSMGILGQPASLFAEYRRDVAEISTIMNKTVEIQGRLIKMLSDVAAKY